VTSNFLQTLLKQSQKYLSSTSRMCANWQGGACGLRCSQRAASASRGRPDRPELYRPRHSSHHAGPGLPRVHRGCKTQPCTWDADTPTLELVRTSQDPSYGHSRRYRPRWGLWISNSDSYTRMSLSWKQSTSEVALFGLPSA